MLPLLHKVEQQVCEQLPQAAVVLAEVRVRFDPAREVSWIPGPRGLAGFSLLDSDKYWGHLIPDQPLAAGEIPTVWC